MENQNTPRQILTVTQLTNQIKALLENEFPFIWIGGEISNFTAAASGHFYFSLKDDAAQISAIMFRAQNRNLQFRPENGMSILGFGRIAVYPPRGRYQVIFEYLEPSGIGALQAAFEQLKKKLAQEGLFDDEHKKPLPHLPQHIGIITSPTGAVVHDILRVLAQRFDNLDIDILPVRVQGEDAPEEIAAAFDILKRHSRAEVVILARGGGSLEDLQAFNSEIVARAIFACSLPVISAVGHETDFTIADFVADQRAATPTAAAGMIVPDKRDLINRLGDLNDQLFNAIRNQVKDQRTHLSHLSDRIVDPRSKIEMMWQQLDENQRRLAVSISAILATESERMAWRTERLFAISPKNRIEKHKLMIDEILIKILKSIQINTLKQSKKISALHATIKGLNPMAVLERGYSITRDPDTGRVVTQAESVSVGNDLEILLAKGRLGVRITSKG